MVYSANLKQAIGAVRYALNAVGIARQDNRFGRHGEHEPDSDAPLVLVACSGGRDSLALAGVAGIVCAMQGVRCGAVVVDHRLQPGSSEVARKAAAQCETLNLAPVVVRTVNVDGARRAKGTEDAARVARYRVLTDVARRLGATVVLLAHTRDDQAETVLIDLARSAGVDALSGMPRSFERDGVRFVRPFLDLTRAQTTGICGDLGLTWWDDPTNGDGVAANEALPQSYPLRSRVRHTLVPYLTDFFGADVSTHLASVASLARDDKEYLDEMADAVHAQAVELLHGDALQDLRASRPVARLDVTVLRSQHCAIRRRVIARTLAELGISFTARHVEAVDALIVDWHGQGGVRLPSQYSANRQRHVIRVCQNGTYADC
jgi:tRNA(Ile)-lysidine synthase